MHTIFVVFHVLICLGIIGLVLIQHGKGADAGAAFGTGASSTVFGSRGSGSFLTHLTSGLAAAFFLTSLILAYFYNTKESGSNIEQHLQNLPAAQTQPATTTPVNTSDLPPAAVNKPESGSSQTITIPVSPAPASATTETQTPPAVTITPESK